MSRRASIPVLLAVAFATLLSAHVAFALFSAKASGGPFTVASASLSAPKTVKAAQQKCKSNRSPEILLEWTATSSAATEYVIERATSSSGPYVEVVSVPISQTSYIDNGSLGYSTTYYYRVSATVESWSATSSSTAVKTLGKLCV